jgi:DNA primase
MPAEYEPSLWPLAARVFLYRCGISNVEIQQLGYYWNARIQRVVMPIRDAAGGLLYWQARTLDKTNPKKYLNQRGVDKHSFVAKYGDGPIVVLTEDILSSYKVSRAGVEAWPLMGTKLSTTLAAEIIRDGRPVAVWTDPDVAGRTAAAKICKTLRAYGVKVTNVVSVRDPKLIPREEIICKLQKLCELPGYP